MKIRESKMAYFLMVLARKVSNTLRVNTLCVSSELGVCMPEQYARESACTVLRELGGGDAAQLPGSTAMRKGVLHV